MEEKSKSNQHLVSPSKQHRFFSAHVHTVFEGACQDGCSKRLGELTADLLRMSAGARPPVTSCNPQTGWMMLRSELCLFGLVVLLQNKFGASQTPPGLKAFLLCSTSSCLPKKFCTQL